MQPPLLATCAVAALAAVTGCVDASERSTDYAYLHAAIIEPSCATANCHSAMTAQQGLDLSTPATCDDLVANYVCPGAGADCANPFGIDVHGLLINRLRATDGLLMPQDGPLPESDIQLIETWIEEGASCE
ncbi:MAG: hypothetical protein H6709_23655 [Kofleriaceae bacterium]|nr:hypothetical protein [Myxococcales bacterium]MCB9565004.1 hypothetical protein [Kofleriaceae bacterium]MCB9575083.1 hypothetical protein [Kofleriaceae bacterium]